MSTRVRIQMVPDFEGVLEQEGGVRAEIRTRAEVAAGFARSTAPVASGDYKKSIGVEWDRRKTLNRGRPVMLVATDFKANWIEKGTIRNRARRTLTNAAQAVASRIRVE